MADLPNFHGRRIVKPESLHRSKLPSSRRAQKNNYPDTRRHSDQFPISVSSPSRQASRSSGHSSSRSADFVPTISTSQLDSPSRRGSRTPESPRTWVGPLLFRHLAGDWWLTSTPQRRSSQIATTRPTRPGHPSQLGSRAKPVHSDHSTPPGLHSTRTASPASWQMRHQP